MLICSFPSSLDSGRPATSTLNRFSALQQSGSLLSSSDSDRRVPQRYTPTANISCLLHYCSPDTLYKESQNYISYISGPLSHLQPVGQAPAVSVVATETGVIVTGTDLTDSIAAKDEKVATTGAPGTKSLREVSAESPRSAVGGVETVGPQMSQCVAWPA